MLHFRESFSSTPHYSAISKESIEILFRAICEERDAKSSGYYELPYQQSAILEARKYLKENSDLIKRVQNLIIIGIGGSSLGLKAIDSMLSHLSYRKDINLKFLEHTDPIRIEKSLKKVRLKNSLFIVISKSGTTIETSSLMKYVLKRYDLLESAGAKRHLCFITDVHSPLAKFGAEAGITTFTIHKNIGGRFSVLSSVGIVPLMILGYKAENLLSGARNFSERFFNKQEKQMLKKAIFLSNNRDKFHINILFSYSSVFKDFNAWYVQLWGESLGKLNSFGRKSGLTPIALIGSIDQHSFLQLIVQGVMDKTVTFLAIHQKGFTNPKIPRLNIPHLSATNFVNGTSFALLLQRQQISTMEVMQQEGIPTDYIELDRLDERNVGELIMYYELLTSCVGKVLDINAYNQPGVELGKKILATKFK